MPAPQNAHRPYADAHKEVNGPGDARPTCGQVLKDSNAIGALKGKTVLITGCSSGIGVETARALYEAGATVFAAARDMKKLDGVIEDIVKNAKYNKDGPKPQAVELHLDSLDGVRKGAEEFKSKSKELNILINNAGVMACPFGTTKDGLETQIGVNHFAHFVLFQELRSLLLSSAKSSGTPSRVVSLSSAGHRFSPVTFSDRASLDSWNKGEGYQKWKAYGQAKTANIWMANSINRHYASQGIIALSVHPGGIVTELGRHLSSEDLELFGGEEGFKKLQKTVFKSVDQGAATTVWAAVSPHFTTKNGGQYLEDVGESMPEGQATGGGSGSGGAGFKAHAYDEEGEEKLWKLSCEVVGVKDE